MLEVNASFTHAVILSRPPDASETTRSTWYLGANGLHTDYKPSDPFSTVGHNQTAAGNEAASNGCVPRLRAASIASILEVLSSGPAHGP
jgi:hypothetical protein